MKKSSNLATLGCESGKVGKEGQEGQVEKVEKVAKEGNTGKVGYIRKVGKEGKNQKQYVHKKTMFSPRNHVFTKKPCCQKPCI